MTDKLKLFIMKIKLSGATTFWVISKWRYALVATVIAFIFFELIYWSLNMSAFLSIMTSGNISIFEKTAVMISPIHSIIASSGFLFLIILILLSVIQGISLAIIIYIVRHQHKIDDKLVGGSSFVALLAIIGLGCPTCGTSLLTPIVALFASGSAVAISESISVFIFPLALLIGLYSLYSIGLRAANIRAHQMY